MFLSLFCEKPLALWEKCAIFAHKMNIPVTNYSTKYLSQYEIKPGNCKNDDGDSHCIRC